MIKCVAHKLKKVADPTLSIEKTDILETGATLIPTMPEKGFTDETAQIIFQHDYSRRQTEINPISSLRQPQGNFQRIVFKVTAHDGSKKVKEQGLEKDPDEKTPGKSTNPSNV